MNKIKSIYKKNEEVTRLLIIMAFWLIFMAFTQAKKFYTGMNFLTMAGQFREGEIHCSCSLQTAKLRFLQVQIS